MKATITISVLRNADDSPHIVIETRPNDAELTGPLRETVETMLRAVVNSPGWTKTVDVRATPMLRLATEEASK